MAATDEDDKVVRHADLVGEGADALREFIGSVFDKEASDQAYMEIVTDDGVLIDKAELVFDGQFYRLRLSGL